MIGHGVQRIRKRVLRLQYGFTTMCQDASVTFPMINVVTWYKQEVNRVFEQEVNLVLVDVLPVSC